MRASTLHAVTALAADDESRSMTVCFCLRHRWRSFGESWAYAEPRDAEAESAFPPDFYTGSATQLKVSLSAFYWVATLIVTGGLVQLGVFIDLQADPQSHPQTSTWSKAFVWVLAVAVLCTSAATLIRHGSLWKRVRLDPMWMPSLMKLLLQPQSTHTEYMVSYSWGVPRIAAFARQLSQTLPMCWIDVEAMAAGDYLPLET